jgi:hypothetical protein
MILFYIAFGSLVVLSITLLYVIRNLLRKLEVYEDWVSYFGEEIQKVYKNIKDIDNKHWFEDDDDVGQTFKELARIISEFKERIK